MKERENNRKRDRYGKEKYRKRDCLRERERLGSRFGNERETGFGERERK